MDNAGEFDPAKITAAILAGGAGSRLGGRDKGLQLLIGKPLVAHVVAAITGQAGSIVICINRNKSEYAAHAQTCLDAAAGFRGPLAGITSALRVGRGDWVLTLPVDGPRPPRDLAVRLWLAATRAAARCAVAHDGMRRQPLFALYRRELAATAATALTNDWPVWRWQDACGAVEADFSDVPEAFANLNTVEDFRLWEARDHG
jgi:molybdopterin-guanine dinucleotide biosynthesis protein A